MTHRILNPAGLPPPKGYSHGILAPVGGRLLFVAGQTAMDAGGRIVGRTFADQIGRALESVAAVLKEAGGQPHDICRMTIYVTDKRRYMKDLKGVGAAYRRVMGRHFPAMALVEVKALLAPRAMVEVEATAVIPA